MSVTQSDRDRNAVLSSQKFEPLPAQDLVPPNWGRKRRLWVIPLVLILAVVPLALGWRILMSDSSAADDSLVYYTVKRGTLPITVTERGNLESQNTEDVICEVENFGGDRSGQSGTQILFIVPNGSSVKKGDLLVELDAAPLQELRDSQYLSLQRAEAEKIQAESKYENQETQNETNLAEAELAVKLAELSLTSYEDEEGGTFQIELQNIDMQIKTARASQMIEKSDRDAIEELHKLGYKSKGDLEAAKLALLRANSDLASQIARLEQLREYEYTMEKMTRTGKLETAVRSVKQVLKNNESELAQAKAAMESAKQAYEKEEERYTRYEEQLEKCKIYSPQDGMVAYAVDGGRRGGGGSAIEEGAFVRQRQQILTIPDLTRMQVNTAVHESVLDQVDQGLPAIIRVDAFPERSYKGSVKTVAVLPDQGGWMSSDTKVYKTIVTIDEEVQQLKPGMTAVVEIDIEKLQNVISIPIQAIVQRGSSNWVYVAVDGKLDRREVTLGKTNEKFVEIRDDCLKEGEIVVLNPMSLVDEEAATKAEAAKKEADEGGEEGEGDAADGDLNTGLTAEAEATDGGAAPEGKGPRGGQRGGPGAGKGWGGGAPAGTGAQPSGRGDAGGPQGQKRPNGKGGGGGFSFAQFDKDGDGKLTKDELPERMQPFFDNLDANKDGVIEQSEMSSMQGRRPPTKE